MDARDWWRGAVIYQIYPRSFMDSVGDGMGDLPGITQRLDYLASLGVDAVWISPFFTSPMKDFGYDISDYRSVDPSFGTLDDFRRLLDRAHRLGLKVIVDQVLSHTSDEHPWFGESRRSRSNAYSDWFVWADPKPDGSPPNNWLSMFGGPAWTWDSRRRQYYLHHFLASQPDLNFHHPEVREAQLDNVRHWLDLGVDGLRLDVVNFYFHRADLRSNPPAVDDPERTPTTSPDNPFSFQQHLYDITQPENLAFIEALRRLTNDYPGVFLLGEISDDHSIDVMASYTQGQDRLHTAYTFELLGPNSAADYLRGVLARIDAGLGEGWPCWALSNHDVVRCASRWGRGAEPEAFTPVAMALLLSLRGTVCLYQGEELGLEQAEVPFDRIQDPYGVPFWPEYKGRDGARTPMVWESGPHGGFSTGEPWLPVDPRHAERAVSFQEEDESRCLHAIRALLAWRRRQPALRKGSLSLVKDSGEMLMWRRTSEDQDLVCAFNLTDRTLKASLPFEIRRRHQVTFADGGLLAEGQLTLGPFQTFFADVGAHRVQQE